MFLNANCTISNIKTSNFSLFVFCADEYAFAYLFPNEYSAYCQQTRQIYIEKKIV